MKTCPVCQLALEDSYLFCPDDGSSLGVPTYPDTAEMFIDDRKPGDRESEPDPALPVVLYCPTCAAEYPLTFSACPVHAAPLVRHSIPRFVESKHESVATKATEPLTTLPFARPQVEPEPAMIAADPGDGDIAIDAPAAQSARGLLESDDSETERIDPVSLIDPVNPFPSFDHRDSSERPGFRLAAIATVVALSFLGLVALFMLFSNLSRRRATTPARVATQTETDAQVIPFIETPAEARNYEEEPVVVAEPPPKPAIDSSEHQTENKASKREPAPHKLVIAQTTPSSFPASPPPARMAKVSNPSPMPALPRGDAGGFDARLVRVRSNRTGSGVRYDLTFNMQEQAGRPAHWQRLLITTRSASGLSHSQAIPFVHRLGPAGALTFTVSVEMAGRSEADVQGRVVCTTLGWDNNDHPLQASFGANVTP